MVGGEVKPRPERLAEVLRALEGLGVHQRGAHAGAPVKGTS